MHDSMHHCPEMPWYVSLPRTQCFHHSLNQDKPISWRLLKIFSFFSLDIQNTVFYTFVTVRINPLALIVHLACQTPPATQNIQHSLPAAELSHTWVHSKTDQVTVFSSILRKIAMEVVSVKQHHLHSGLRVGWHSHELLMLTFAHCTADYMIAIQGMTKVFRFFPKPNIYSEVTMLKFHTGWYDCVKLVFSLLFVACKNVWIILIKAHVWIF